MKNKKSMIVSILIVFLAIAISSALVYTQPSTPVDNVNQVQKAQVREVHQPLLDPPVLNLFADDIKIVAMGDSLTKGVGDPTGRGGYLRFLKKDLLHSGNFNSINITNLGVTGLRSDELIKRLDREKYREALTSADQIYITIGGNDLVKIMYNNIMSLTITPFMAETEPYGKRIETILKETRKINKAAPIFLIGMYNPFSKFFKDIDEMNTIVKTWDSESRSIVQQFDNITFIPIRDIFLDTSDNLLYEDNFHPNVDGYKRIATRVDTYVEQALDTSDE
ncbi:SGNH/GDSL hydrolase family protein [Aureibacillus halotolerans]|uniref:Lysophospholipase L1-like esterase n=1 Tax=Aureibacillus halotolerans TaxID=1508390 RepID=A0A4R6U6K1_9BACI|nr:SGNH/GDSL hydrolase family protein [Aureibacillus halotolerans]TDQ40329.1 lysophospholipase L1-like esterase [Aureibacillus halotolerans]